MAMLAGAAMPLGAASPQAPGEVAVTVTGLRSAKGLVHACLTSQPKSFPNCSSDPSAHRLSVPAADRVELLFHGVESGRYAIALLHDENSNNKADRVLGMMPKEGFGFSRDAPVRMGPPSFDAAAFDYAGDAKALQIRMRYML